MWGTDGIWWQQWPCIVVTNLIVLCCGCGNHRTKKGNQTADTLEMVNKCRVCLQSSQALYYSLLTVFPEFARKSLSILDLLSSVTSEKVDFTNNLPSQICFECFKLLKSAYSFIVLYKNSQEFLLKNHTNDLHDVDSEQNLSNENQEPFLDDDEEKIIIITENDDENDDSAQIVEDEFEETEFPEIESVQDEDDNSNDIIDDVLEEDYTELTEEYQTEEIVGMETDTLEEVDIATSEDNSDNEDQQEIITIEESAPKKVKSGDRSQQVYSCNICDGSYPALKNLLDHMRKKHPKAWGKFESKSNRSDGKNQAVVYECKTCNIVLNSQSHFIVHKYKFHRSDSDRFRCRYCNKICKNSSALGYHKLVKHSTKKFTCDVCQKSFVSSTVLKLHVRAVHDKTVPENHLCPQCGKGFKYSTGLKYHLAKVHTGERFFACNICDRKFILIGELKAHELTHTGERPFKCAHCEKTFRRSGEKTMHEKTHLGIYPYKCQYCNEKEFTAKYNMQVHWLRHLGNYSCDICHKGYASVEILKFHYRVRHKITNVHISTEELE